MSNCTARATQDMKTIRETVTTLRETTKVLQDSTKTLRDCNETVNVESAKILCARLSIVRES